MELIWTIIGAWFFADFVTGVLHWVQDQYLTSNTKISILRSIAKDNDLHHTKPNAMANNTLWKSTETSIVPAATLYGVCLVTSAPLLFWIGITFGIFANVIHSFNHKADFKVPVFAKVMRKTGLFQSKKHHAIHHFSNGKVISKEDTTVRYCVMTDYLNPTLDFIRFFPILERIISILGLKSHRLQKLEKHT